MIQIKSDSKIVSALRCFFAKQILLVYKSKKSWVQVLQYISMLTKLKFQICITVSQMFFVVFVVSLYYRICTQLYTIQYKMTAEYLQICGCSCRLVSNQPANLFLVPSIIMLMSWRAHEGRSTWIVHNIIWATRYCAPRLLRLTFSHPIQANRWRISWWVRV